MGDGREDSGQPAAAPTTPPPPPPKERAAVAVDGDDDDAAARIAAAEWTANQDLGRGSLDRVRPGATGQKRSVALAWRHVRYTVFPRGAKGPARDVLSDVSGSALPGRVLAVMGPTGGGKSSLLNVLSGRVPAGGELTGTVTSNGKNRDRSFMSRDSAYVMQEDLLSPFLTVRETFALHAHLRLPSSTTAAERDRAVEELIKELGLVAVADAAVGKGGGGFPRGLSGGERKRCNIGVELVASPMCIFLDEPTSGLDSFQAQNVMCALRDIASAGRSIVTCIHQPRSSIFAMFDKLLLLSVGRLVFIGDADDAVLYFSDLHFTCPQLSNPADFFMDIISPDVRDDRRKSAAHARIELFTRVCAARCLGERAADEASAHAGVVDATKAGAYNNASFLLQFALLFQRAWRSMLRDFAGVAVALMFEVVYGLIVAALYRNVGMDQKGVQNRIGCLFFVALNVAYNSALPAVQMFAEEKDVVLRERASGAYTCAPYYWSKYLAELPKLSVRIVFCVIVYFIVGLNDEMERFFGFVAVVLLEALSAQAFGVVIAAGLPLAAALAVGPALITILTLFGGIYLNIDSLPPGAQWVRYIDFVFYSFSGLVVNEFDGVESFACEEGESSRCLADGEAVLEFYSFDGIKLWEVLIAQLALGGVTQVLGYYTLLRSSTQFQPLLTTAPSGAPHDAVGGVGAIRLSS